MGFWASNIEDSVENAISYRISLKRLKLSELANEQRSKSVIGGKKPKVTFYNNYSISSSDGELNVLNPNNFQIQKMKIIL